MRTFATEGRLVGQRFRAHVAGLRIGMANGHELVRVFQLGLVFFFILSGLKEKNIYKYISIFLFFFSRCFVVEPKQRQQKSKINKNRSISTVFNPATEQQGGRWVGGGRRKVNKKNSPFSCGKKYCRAYAAWMNWHLHHSRTQACRNQQTNNWIQNSNAPIQRTHTHGGGGWGWVIWKSRTCYIENKGFKFSFSVVADTKLTRGENC